MELIHDPLFQKALPVLQAIEKEGYEAYFVGGSIRDGVLGLPIHDVDIATSAYPEEVQKIFPKHFDVGLQHGTVMAWVEGETYEITTFRTESEYEDYRRPKEVTFVRSLKEDVLRRDFTINALAMTTKGEIRDYFNGLEDLKKKQLKAVGEPLRRFQEDALRLLRAIRFSSQLDFDIEADTLEAMKKTAPLLEHISVERITSEFDKLWIGKNWKKGLAYGLKTGLIDYVPNFPHLKERVSDVIDQLSNKTFFSSSFSWAILLYLNQSSEEEIHQFVKAWKRSNEEEKRLVALVEILNFRTKEDWTMQNLYGKDLALVQEVEAFILQEKEENSPFGQLFLTSQTNVETLYEQLPLHSLKDLDLNGKDVVKELNKKGKEIGLALKKAEKEVVEGHWENNKAFLLEKLKEEY